jgi:hypothetical protein
VPALLQPSAWPAQRPAASWPTAPRARARRLARLRPRCARVRLQAWIERFPEDPLGDPDSTYWKPELEGVVGMHVAQPATS